jgi:hypothetical protein
MTLASIALIICFATNETYATTEAAEPNTLIDLQWSSTWWCWPCSTCGYTCGLTITINKKNPEPTPTPGTPPGAMVFIMSNSSWGNVNNGDQQAFETKTISGNNDPAITQIVSGGINQPLYAPQQTVVYSTAFGGYIGYFIPQ